MCMCSTEGRLEAVANGTVWSLLASLLRLRCLANHIRFLGESSTESELVGLAECTAWPLCFLLSVLLLRSGESGEGGVSIFPGEWTAGDGFVGVVSLTMKTLPSSFLTSSSCN